MDAERKQTPLGDHQIRQAEQHHQLWRVLEQSTITSLLEAKAILDDEEGMLDLGADPGLDRFHLITQAISSRSLSRLSISANNAAEGVTVAQAHSTSSSDKPMRLLQEVHAQHPFSANRRVPSSFASRVIRRPRHRKVRPRREYFKFAKQPLALRHLALAV